MRILTIFILFLSFSAMLSGQSKKDIRTRKITSQTVQEYFIAEGLKEPVIEKIEKYDTLGNVVLLKEFNKESEVKNWKKFVYSEDGELLEEVKLDSKGNLEEKIVYTYQDGLIVEKKYYDKKERLYKRKAYNYTYR